MNLTVYLNNGMSFDVPVEKENYNAQEFSAMMNESKIVTVAIGSMIVNKNAIFLILPSEVVENN